MALKDVKCPRCGAWEQVGIPKGAEIVDVSKGSGMLPDFLRGNKGTKEVWCEASYDPITGRHSFVVTYEK